MNLNEHLAIKVMGWEYVDNPQTKSEAYYDRPRPDLLIRVSAWNPSENIEQAMSLLTNFEYKKMWQELESHWIVEVGNHPSNITIIRNSLLEMAISLAVAKATGWEE